VATLTVLTTKTGDRRFLIGTKKRVDMKGDEQF